MLECLRCFWLQLVKKIRRQIHTYLLFYYPNTVTETGEVIFDTKLIKIKTDPKRGEKVFKKAIEILQFKESPKSGADCGFCKWEINVTLKVQ